MTFAFRSVLAELWLDLLALLWPTACVHCGEPDRECCLSCLVAIARPSPLLRPAIRVACFARAPYDGELRSLLVAFKHEGRTGLARDLAAQLRPPLRAALAQCVGPCAPVLVTAPSRPASRRKRGYAHVELLLRMALRGEGIPALRVGALRTMTGRRSQVGLRAAERAQNAELIAVRRSARRALRGREVIIVDDIVTTGATVEAARDALESAGARVVAAAALCHAARRDTREKSVAVNVVAT